MSVLLPPSIALKSSHFDLYLNYSDDSYSSAQGFVRFNGANFSSPPAKFEVVTANTGSGVHIRCRKNRKFLRRKTVTSIFISPEAAEPEEDTTKWGCTLFEPRVVEAGNTTKVYLFHVQSQYYANAWDVSGVRSLRINSTTPNAQGIYHILDLDTMVILPKHVAFKGTGDKYLEVHENSPSNTFFGKLKDKFLGVFLMFTSTDKESATSWFETTTDGDGRVLIQASSNKQCFLFIELIFPLIVLVNYSTNQNYWFSPVKLDGSTVALKSLGNNKFCIEVADILMASSTSIENSSRLTIEELVISRRIYNTEFDLDNAIIYDETPKSMATATSTNNSSEENTVELKLPYTESRSTTWTASHSWMVGLSVNAASFKVPFIGGTDVTANAEYSGSYKWGETLTSETTLEATYTATVPAHSSITVTMMATEGKCDVTYSFYQRDQLNNGETVIYQKDDGLCTGINSYNFHYEVTTAKISDLETREQKVPDPSIDPTVKILLSDLFEPTPVTSTMIGREQEEEIVQDASALSTQEGGENVA